MATRQVQVVSLFRECGVLASLTLPTPAPAGSYSWSFSLQIKASIYRDEPRSFTIVERPTPPPPPAPPAPSAPPAPPAPPAPQPSPAGGAVVPGVTADSFTILLPPGVPGTGLSVYTPAGTLSTTTFGGHPVTFASLSCGTPYEAKIERRDNAGNLLSTQIVSATTEACPFPTSKPSSPPKPLAPQPKVWAFKSPGTVGGVARLRVATEVGAKYGRFS